MGLRREYIEYIDDSIAGTLGGIQGKQFLELGNQRIRRGQGIRERTGKAYYTRLGAIHTSLDFNGKDGAVALDLSRLHDEPEWRGRFDIISNPGTTEHVEPFESQFECFANIHNWLRTGGIAIHIVPAAEELERGGRWKNHCNNYYSRAFFEALAAANGYELISAKVINQLWAACLRKNADRPFTDGRAAFLRHLTRREGGIEYRGIDDPGRRRPGHIARTWLRKLGFR